MDFLILLISLLLSLCSILVSGNCPTCDVDKCLAVLNCPYGIVTDECNCCQMCGKGENEICDRYRLKCSDKLFCNITGIRDESHLFEELWNETGICTRIPITVTTLSNHITDKPQMTKDYSDQNQTTHDFDNHTREVITHSPTYPDASQTGRSSRALYSNLAFITIILLKCF